MRNTRQTLAAGTLPASGDGALQVRQALLVAAMLTGVTLLVTQADRLFGQAGTLASVALAGLADAHAGVTAVAALSTQGRLGVASAGSAVLLHMDLKPDNLLVDPATLAQSAMIDWDMATRGPRSFDLAVLLSYWIEPGDPDAVKSLLAVPSLTPGWPGRVEVASRYQAICGQTVGDLVWPLALARLRLAVAWMQLYRKWQRGEMVGSRYQGFEPLALAILAHALDQFRKGAL
jgi:hypothetical protein